MSKEIHSVEWFEHKDIRALNDWVEKYFNKKTIDEYYDLGGDNFEDFKKSVDNWIYRQKEQLDQLLELVDELPDDTHEYYEVDEEDNHVGIPDE